MALPKKYSSKDVESIFDRFLEEPFMNFWKMKLPEFEGLKAFDTSFPKVDMFEKGNNLVVKIDVPGIDKKNISVSISDNVLHVKGEFKKEEKVEEEDYFYSERSSGSFSRRIRLPLEVEQSRVKAKFKDGVLEVELPKGAKSKPKEVKVDVK